MNPEGHILIVDDEASSAPDSGTYPSARGL